MMWVLADINGRPLTGAGRWAGARPAFGGTNRSGFRRRQSSPCARASVDGSGIPGWQALISWWALIRWAARGGIP